jgi:spore maturation protein CgeB
LIEKANFYLGHPEERERVAKAGAEAIAARHTYYHRWRVVEPYIKEWYGNFRKERVNEA